MASLIVTSLVNKADVGQLFDSLQKDAQQQANVTAQKTIRAFRFIFEDRDKISSFQNEAERNAYITAQCLFLAEPNFCVGRSAEELKQSLAEKALVLLNLYQEAKQKGRLDGFFEMLGKTQRPCFNGRVINLMEYAAQQFGVSADVFDVSYDVTSSMIIFNALSDYCEEINAIKVPAKEEFIRYLQKQEEFAIKFKPIIDRPNFESLFQKASQGILIF